MAVNENLIRQIVSETLDNLTRNGVEIGAPAGGWIFDDMNDAIAAAKASQQQLRDYTLEKRSLLLASMRRISLDNLEYLARVAHEETGYGKIPDKIEKNKVAALKTPGIEDLHPVAYSGDNGLTLVEGAPFGVIGSITPSTNPTSTIINNSISMIAAGNAVVYNPHPAAAHASQEAMRLLNEAIVAAGGPPALIATVKTPTLDTSKVLMSHPDIKLLSVTGGEAVVNVAMKSGKKVVAAGPGNPPVIVDETADIEQAARDIVDGASLDNNVLCVAEKECFIVESVFDRLVSAMIPQGCWKVEGADIDRIVATVFQKDDSGCYVVNRAFVGRDATHILRESGVQYTGDPRLVIAEVDKDHPFVVVEMLMPVLGMVRVRNFDEALEEAFIAEHGNKHSAMIHSTNIHNMSRAAERMDTTIFVKNAPSYSGLGYEGEGYATLTIATPTGEGLTSARSFTRARRCVLKGDFRII
jgi:propionaldehyde dehydrogenase